MVCDHPVVSLERYAQEFIVDPTIEIEAVVTVDDIHMCTTCVPNVCHFEMSKSFSLCPKRRNPTYNVGFRKKNGAQGGT